MLFLSLIDGDAGHDPLYEERVVLVCASSEEEAEVEARRYGLREAHEYRNSEGEEVAWILHSVEQVTKVGDQPGDVTWEVMSRYLRQSELPKVSEES